MAFWDGLLSRIRQSLGLEKGIPMIPPPIPTVVEWLRFAYTYTWVGTRSSSRNKFYRNKVTKEVIDFKRGHPTKEQLETIDRWEKAGLLEEMESLRWLEGTFSSYCLKEDYENIKPVVEEAFQEIIKIDEEYGRKDFLGNRVKWDWTFLLPGGNPNVLRERKTSDSGQPIPKTGEQIMLEQERYPDGNYKFLDELKMIPGQAANNWTEDPVAEPPTDNVAAVARLYDHTYSREPIRYEGMIPKSWVEWSAAELAQEMTRGRPMTQQKSLGGG